MVHYRQKMFGVLISIIRNAPIKKMQLTRQVTYLLTDVHLSATNLARDLFQ